MTREEAIKSALKYLVHKQQEQGSWGYADNDNINKVPWDEALEWIDQQPCGDLISRQAVLDLAKSGRLVSNGNYKSVCDAINGLPSVEVETCGDCVSRQAVIDTIETDCSWDIFNEWGSRTPTGECIINAIKSVPSVETKSCGDCISRQKVLNSISYEDKQFFTREHEVLSKLRVRVSELPSVEPERKTGKWIDEGQYADGYSSHAYRCSECGGHIIEYRPDDFCKYCGADMREVAGE